MVSVSVCCYSLLLKSPWFAGQLADNGDGGLSSVAAPRPACKCMNWFVCGYELHVLQTKFNVVVPCAVCDKVTAKIKAFQGHVLDYKPTQQLQGSGSTVHTSCKTVRKQHGMHSQLLLYHGFATIMLSAAG